MMAVLPVGGVVETSAMVALTLAALLAFVRLMRGPSLPDRVVALDLLATLGMGMFAVYAMATGQPAYLDVGIVLALITFIATISFAYFLEKGTMPRRRERP